MKRLLHVRRSKNETSQRVIPLNAAAIEAVARMLERADLLGHTEPGQYPWPACQWGRYDPSKPMLQWDSAWRALRDGAGLHGLRFHDLRHTVITELAEMGIADHVLESISGHLSRRMLEHYSHIRIDAKRQALDALDAARRVIQVGMAAALLLAGLFMTMGLLQLYPAGGDALSLTPPRLIVALVANLVLGALVTLGIGSYGPSLVLFSLLGMEPRAAFPIMMGSGAFMGMVAAMRFVSSGRYSARAALGLTLGGIPGVLIAVWLVRSLPLDLVRWGVIVVVLYTAVTLIRSAVEERRTLAAARAGVPVGL